MSRRSQKDKKAKSQPKAVDFNLTPQGVLIKTSNNPETIGFFDQKMAAYEKQLKSMDSDYAYSIALGKIQLVVDEVQMNKRRPISCQAGCSACCHQKVDLGAFEGAMIEKYLRENPVAIDPVKLKKQTDALRSEPGSFEALPFEDRRCVFLSSGQTCSIYSVRPLMCRRHFVQSDPTICRTEEFFRLEMDVNPDTDAYLSAYVGDGQDSLKNPQLVLESFSRKYFMA
jgi:Fe-S-cluster containining protein